MEAGRNGTAGAKPIEYGIYAWGEVIEGSKADLQALGLGRGMAFPGEPFGPARTLRLRDPRGLLATIQGCGKSGDLFAARIPYEGLPKDDTTERSDAGFGVVYEKRPGSDCYTGPADGLVRLGLVLAEQLPGAPGMRKQYVTIYPDGRVANGPRGSSNVGGRAPGAKWIARLNKSAYQVSIFVDEAESTRRHRASWQARRDWEARASRVPKPARLKPLAAAAIVDFERACAAAARDTGFQHFLARVASAKPGE